MAEDDQRAVQREIIEFLEVVEHFDAASEAKRRIEFLREQIVSNARRAIVLGISGGVDSTVTGRICQLAVEAARKHGHEARFIAVRLPYGNQRDEEDAKQAVEFIQPDRALTVDIQPASDGLLAALHEAGAEYESHSHRDFVLGNIKARERMVAQYALAGANHGMVVGTDHAAEAVMGFFTKFGDGAFDTAPLYGLTKRWVREIGNWLGAPENLVTKVPTADLESLQPLLPDEQAMGVTYREIDDFLEGKEVSESASQTIIEAYRKTAHKRALATTP